MVYNRGKGNGSANLYLHIDGSSPGNLLGMQNASIEDGFFDVFSFPWTPSSAGKMTLTISVNEVNPEDENPENNVVRKSFTVGAAEPEKDAMGEPSSDFGTSVLMLGISAGIVLTFYILLTEIGRYGFYSFMLPLYTRLKKAEIVLQEVRGRIYQIIVSNPGIHFRAIQREYQKKNHPELHMGGLCYHLDVLLKNGFIKSKNDGYKKRFYSRGIATGKEFKEQVRETVTEYYQANNRGISKKELMSTFNVSERVIRYNIGKLSNVIKVEKSGRRKRYIPLDI
jgi:hypothetical protein